MLHMTHRCDRARAATVSLTLDFESRRRSRLRTRLDDGTEALLNLPRGTVLRNGDKLLATDGRVVEVIAAAQSVATVRTADPRLLARAAYHLGNRHVPVQIGEGWLSYACDHVLDEMVRGLGLAVVAETAPFEPEAGAYHGH